MNWELFVTSAITILGFIVTYFMTKKSFKDEVKKSKVAISLEKMEEIPFKLTSFTNKMGNNQVEVEEYSELLSMIYAYCSREAIIIATEMQHTLYENANNLNEENPKANYKALALISLLITQIKYDLTGEIVNPELWFIMKINDYTESGAKEVIRDNLYQCLKQLNLNSEFLADIK